jgi:3-methylfumaryl-CoA hydratase
MENGEWPDWVGRSSTSEAHLYVEQANRMAATLDRDPSFQPGDQLPPGWHWLYCHDIVKASDIGPDGHPKLGVTMPPVPLPRRMWAGGSLVFHEPLRLGETVERTSIIRSITPKEGRSGPLYFVAVEHIVMTKGALNLVEEQTIVYRALTSDAQPSKAQAAPIDADYSRRYALDSTTLFRFSALTFNGHRIHYDLDYCRDVEGYPNLVVHGPLIATLLLDLYVQHNRGLKHFSYRAKSPLFLPHAFTVNGKADGRAARLWASNHEGGLAMEADVDISD